MFGWHHQLNGHEFKQSLGDTKGQGSLLCCSPWGCRESAMTEQMKKKFFFDTRKLIVRNKIAFSTSINASEADLANCQPIWRPTKEKVEEVSKIRLCKAQCLTQ